MDPFPSLPFSQLFKNMFLDAIGADMASPRRNAHQGMWHKHVLNEGTDREIEVGCTVYNIYMYLFIKLHVTAQPGADILIPQ